MTALNQPTACLCLALWAATMFTHTLAAPAPVADGDLSQSQALDLQNDQGAPRCYYNFQHYDEGDRITTNEPCLNCTCHKRMLMCYLRVCPFTKPVGQNCTVEKRPDQCCPVITCPQVPVDILLSSSTTEATTSSAVGHVSNYGCTLEDNTFYPDGVQMPSDPRKPCELCYCIRNHTACVRQECTLNVEGCRPVYQDGVCCPVKYDCDYNELTSSASASTTEQPTTSGLIVNSTPSPLQCHYGDAAYNDGEMVDVSDKPCQTCYCFNGDIVCAVRSCGDPLEHNKHCTPVPPPEGQCCPSSYECSNGTIPSSSQVAENSLALDSSDKQTKEPITEFDRVEEDTEESTLPSEEHSTMVKSEEEVPYQTDKPNSEDDKLPEQTVEDTIEDQSENNGEHIIESDPVDGSEELAEEDILAQNNLESNVDTGIINHSALPAEPSGQLVTSSPFKEPDSTTITLEEMGQSETGSTGIVTDSEKTDSNESQQTKGNKPEIEVENAVEHDGPEASDYEANSNKPEVIPHESNELEELQPTEHFTDNLQTTTEGGQESINAVPSHPEVSNPGKPTEINNDGYSETLSEVEQESPPIKDNTEMEKYGPNTEGNSTEIDTRVAGSETEHSAVSTDPIPLPSETQEGHNEQVSSESDKDVTHDTPEGQVSQSEGDSSLANNHIHTEEHNKHSETPDTSYQVLDSNNLQTDDITTDHETGADTVTVGTEHNPNHSSTETNLIIAESVGVSEESSLQTESLLKEPVPPPKDDSVPKESEPRPQHPQGSMTKAEDSIPTDPQESVTLNTDTSVKVDEPIPSEGVPVETNIHGASDESTDKTINRDGYEEPVVETTVSHEQGQDHSDETNEPIPNTPEEGSGMASESEAVPNVIISEAESTEEPISEGNYEKDITPGIPIKISGTQDHIIVFDNIDNSEQTLSPIETSEITTVEDGVMKQTDTNAEDGVEEENIKDSGHPEEDNATVYSESSVSENYNEQATTGNEIGSEEKEEQTTKSEEPKKTEEQPAQNHNTDQTQTVISVPDDEIKHPAGDNEYTTEKEYVGESNVKHAPDEPITKIQTEGSSNYESSTNVLNTMETDNNNSEVELVQEVSDSQSTETAPESTSVSQDSLSSDSEKKPIQDSFLITNEYEEVPHDPVESDPTDIEDQIDDNEFPQVPAENEILDDHLQGHGGSLGQNGPITIPGPVGVFPEAGDCSVDGKTYANNTQIPSKSPCHKECKCLSSIVHCQGINCPPPPPQLANCMPVHQGDLCCPVYTCDGSIPEVPQSHNQIATAEAGQQTPGPGIESNTEEEKKEEEEEETTTKVLEQHGSLPVVTQEPGLTNVEVENKPGDNSKTDHTESSLESENDSEKSQTETPVESSEFLIDGNNNKSETNVGENNPGETLVYHDDNVSNSEHHSGEAVESVEGTTKKDEISEEARPDSKPNKEIESQPIPIVEDSETNHANDMSSTKYTGGENENKNTVLTDGVEFPGVSLMESTRPNESPNKNFSLVQDEDSSNPNLLSTSEATQTINYIDIKDSVDQTTQAADENSQSTLETSKTNSEAAIAESSTPTGVGLSDYVSGTFKPEQFEENVVATTGRPSNVDSNIGVNNSLEQDKIQNENAHLLPVTESNSLVQEFQPDIDTSNSSLSHTGSEQEVVKEENNVETPNETVVHDGSQNEVTEHLSHEFTSEQPIDGNAVPATEQSEVNEPMVHQDGQGTNEASDGVLELSSDAPSEEVAPPSDIVGISQSSISEENKQPATESISVDENEDHEVAHPLNAENIETVTIALEGSNYESNFKDGPEEADVEVSQATSAPDSETTEKYQPQQSNSDALSNESVNDNQAVENSEDEGSQTTNDGETEPEGSKVPHENHIDIEVSTEGVKESSSVESQTEELVKLEDAINTEEPNENSEDLHTAEPVISEDTTSTEGYNDKVQIPESDNHKSEEHTPDQLEEQNISHNSEPELELVGTAIPINSEEGHTSDIELSQDDHTNELNTLSPPEEQDTSEPDNNIGTKPKEPSEHESEQPIQDNEQTGTGDQLNYQTVVSDVTDEPPKLPGELGNEDEYNSSNPTESPSDNEEGSAISEDQTSVHEESVVTEQTGSNDIASLTESQTNSESNDFNNEEAHVSEVEIVPEDETTDIHIGNKPVVPEEENAVVHEDDIPSVPLQNIPVDHENEKTEAPLEKYPLDHKHDETEVPVEEIPPVNEDEKTDIPAGVSQNDHKVETPVVQEEPSNTDHEHIPIGGEPVKDHPKPTHEHSEPDEHEENENTGGENTNKVSKPEDSEPETSPQGSHSAAGFITPDTNKPDDHGLGPLPDEYPPSGTDMDYDMGGEDGAFGPGTCRYGGKVYVSAQQIPRDDPCDFCFCFRSDIICLQQSCPPPIHRCHQEPIQGYCCPRYQCPVSMATSLNITTTTTTTSTTLPPHFFAHAYQGAARQAGCLHKGRAYSVGEEITTASGPCLQCICGSDGQMKCDPVVCSPEPMLRKMMEAAVSHRRR